MANPFQLVTSVVVLPVTFCKEVMVELKNVTWPTRQETLRSTLLVIGVSIGVGIYIAGLDLGFTKLFELLLTLKK